jgi:membrane associated rhomboid family serine protease
MALPLRDDLATRRFPWVTIALIAINVVVFLFVQPAAFQAAPPARDHSVRADQKRLDAERFSGAWGAIPCEVASGHPLADHPRQCEGSGDLPSDLPSNKPVYLALVTSMFLHGSLEHLGGNMLFLWVFGNNVEDRLGRLGFLAFYLAGGVVAALGFILFDVRGAGPLIGASGAIAAAMGAYLAFHPRGRVLTAITVAPVQLVYVPAFVVLALFFVTQFFTPDNGVAWQAHAAGMGVGFVVALGLARIPAVRARARADHADLAVRGGRSF